MVGRGLDGVGDVTAIAGGSKGLHPGWRSTLGKECDRTKVEEYAQKTCEEEFVTNTQLVGVDTRMVHGTPPGLCSKSGARVAAGGWVGLWPPE
jgi:hypothetical protein